MESMLTTNLPILGATNNGSCGLKLHNGDTMATVISTDHDDSQTIDLDIK